jgi:drug/metabolite transporter (DMT)-like permease
MLIWALWGLVANAPKTGSSLFFQAASTIGLLPVISVFLASSKLLAGTEPVRGGALAFGSGLCAAAGNLGLLEALQRGGETSVVYPLTGIYPLVTVVLAELVLKERMNRWQVLGVALALAAITLFNLPAGSPEGGEDGAAIFAKAAASLQAPWMTFSLLALVCFGVAAIPQKLATRHISTELSTVCFGAAFAVVALGILLAAEVDWSVPARDWFLAFFWGALTGFGVLTMFAAYRDGKAGVVTAIVALYPALTAVLAVPIFGERFDLRKGIAVWCAVAAGVALSHERSAAPRE